MGSFENIKNFYDYLSKNKDLKKKLSNKIIKISNENTAMNTITNIANKENFIFSVDELKDFIKNESTTLSVSNTDESQLANVAGGKKEPSNDI